MAKSTPHNQNAGPAAADKSATVGAAECQDAPRIYGLFPAKVRGIDTSGAEFEITALLEKLSADDFSLRLARCVAQGVELFVVAQIYAVNIVLRGLISQVEPQPDGACCLTVAITRYQFSSTLADSTDESRLADPLAG